MFNRKDTCAECGKIFTISLYSQTNCDECHMKLTNKIERYYEEERRQKQQEEIERWERAREHYKSGKDKYAIKDLDMPLINKKKENGERLLGKELYLTYPDVGFNFDIQDEPFYLAATDEQKEYYREALKYAAHKANYRYTSKYYEYHAKYKTAKNPKEQFLGDLMKHYKQLTAEMDMRKAKERGVIKYHGKEHKIG